MRKSRLYLGISIIALFVGVALGEANRWLPGCADSCPFTCDNAGADDICVGDRSLERHYRQSFKALRDRDYNAMSRHAQACVDIEHSSFAYGMLGYARRGQAQHSESIALYTKAIDMEREGRNEGSIISDCLIGRAANYIEIGNDSLARRDLLEARMITENLIERTDSEQAHYQLACVFATRSRLSEGRVADDYRKSAMSELKLAINRGFDGWSHMRADLDLIALRDDNRFQNLHRRFR